MDEQLKKGAGEQIAEANEWMTFTKTMIVIFALAIIVLIFLATLSWTKLGDQQRQIDQTNRMISAFVQENPPDKVYGQYRSKWQKHVYYAIPAGSYYLLFANYTSNEAFLIYYPTGAGPGCNLEYFFLDGVPKKQLDEWVDKPCFIIAKTK